jgi:hypothetical protein
MTSAEIIAFNSGVQTALEAARGAARPLRGKTGWKPTREGAADALDELAVTGESLLIRLPGAPRSSERLATAQDLVRECLR